jgi:filamentous hemagglutinin family protein
MNFTYRLILKSVADSGVPSAAFKLNNTRIACLSVLPFFAQAALSAPATTELPSGGQVSAGQASIAVNACPEPCRGGARMDVNQTSQNASINWQTFNIGSDAQVDFHQPDASAIAVNRIADPNGSQIMGRLNANGQIYLINPNGVLFGKGSQVNVGGLVASTLDTADGNTAADRRRTFSATGGNGKIVNQGTLTAAPEGYIALLGNQVSNQGVIQARLGMAALAAGDKVTLEFAGDKLVNVEVDKGALQTLVENKQLIQADGGIVLMTAKAADALLSGLVNNEGVVEARTVEEHNGVIKLLGDMDSGTVNVGGTLDASAPDSVRPELVEGQADGGFIETSAAHVKIADDAKVTTAAANGLTGSWLIDPVDFTISTGSGALSASGIGASTLSTSLGSSNVTITTDGSTAGNGDIFVNAPVSWSANTLLKLIAHGNIYIDANLNGSGSAQLYLAYGQQSATGNGYNYLLRNGAKVSLPAGANFTTEQGYGADNTTLGDGGGTTTNWTVITSLGAAGSVTATDLQGMSGNLARNYVLGADIAASGTSTWNANAGFTAVGTSAAKFTGNFDGLGHTITGLTINSPGWNDGNNNYRGLFGYATGTLRNVGLLNSSITGANIVGALAGRSDGAISNSYADGGSVSASVHQAGGLVGALGATGSISNSYANVSVTGTNYACCGGGVASSNMGGLAGAANIAGSSISNSYATGSVSGGSYVGGLVGQNRANITNSYATGAVTAGNANLGGLIGDQLGGTITNSYWDSATTGQGAGFHGAGGTVTSLTDITAAPKAQASYTGFDFTNTWRIYEGQTRPLLKNFLTALTVTASNASKTYNGLAYSGGNGASYSVAGAGSSSNLLGTLSYGGTSQGAINTGSYVITPSGLYSNQKGYDISYANGTLTVNTAPLTISAIGASKTYDGMGYSGGDGVSYSGFVNGEGSGVLGGTLTYGGNSQGAINAGNYTITPSGLTSSNYAITFTNGALRVNAAPLTVTAGSVTKTYDGLAWSGNNGVSYSGFVNSEDSSVLSGTLAYGGSSQGAINAGSYAITPSGLTSGNYAITFTDGTLTVNAVPLTVTAGSVTKTYDGLAWSGNNGVSYSGFVNGESSAVLSGTLAYGGSAQGAINAGSYAITPSGLTSGNYAITFVDGSLTVNTVPLSVTAIAASKTYDGLAYSGGNGVAYSGFVNGERANVLGGSLAYSGTAQGAVNVGSYIISPSGLTSANYAITYASASLAITPATLTYVATPASFFSGQTPSGLSGTVNGFAAGDTLANSTTGSLVWTTTVAASSPTGRYPINGGGLFSSNYDFVQAASNSSALTLNPNTPPRPVANAMALLESDMLSTPEPDPSTPITPSSAAAGGDSDSLPESGNGIVQNTGMSAPMNIGQINQGLTIVQPGVKLPDNRVHIDE